VNQKCDVNLAILQSNLFVLYSTLFFHVIIQIDPMFDFLLYAKSIVVFLMLLLTLVQLFNDMLLFTLVTTTLMSLVATTMITDLM
jgi:hypothetical protein